MPPLSRRGFLAAAAVAVPALGWLRPADGWAAPRGSEQRHRASLNAGWRFLAEDADAAGVDFDDSTWQPVELPHTWNAKDVLDDTPGYRRGRSWYRRRIRAADLKALGDRRAFLYFEGAAQTAEVWVNGRTVGTHAGAFTAFCMDVTDALAAGSGDAVVAVRVDNSPDPSIPPLSGDFDVHGGLYRNVWLIATDQVHLTLTDHASPGVYVDTPEAGAERALVRIRGTVVNHTAEPRLARVTSRILDAGGQTVTTTSSRVEVPPRGSAGFQQEADLLDPSLWSPDHPYLYKVSTVVTAEGAGDRVDNPLGVRWVSTDPRRGFLLNGTPLRLNGSNRHQDRRGQGTALSDAEHRQDLELVKRTGANVVRLAHYPQAPAVLRACDELGLVVWEEIPVVNQITLGEPFRRRCLTMLREMIRQHFNHPSVALWGYMNEVLLRAEEQQTPEYLAATRALAQELDDLARAEDPRRLTAMACHVDDRYDATGLADIPQVLGWNCYQGWYGGELPDFGRFLDDQHARHPDRTLWVSEYGAESDSRVHALRSPAPFDYSVEYQAAFLHAYLTQIRARPWLAGATLWIHFDFTVEERGGAIPHVNAKGVYRADRTPRDVDWLYRAALRPGPVLHIASREWQRRTGAAGSHQPVTVYTNLDAAELWLDGRSLGSRPRGEGFAVTWQVPFADGANRLEARAGEHRDELRVHFTARPRDLAQATLPRLAVNAGADTQFIAHDGLVWEADQAYGAGGPDGPGGWGHQGGAPGRKQVNIIATDEDPLWQSYLEGLAGYRLDVADGPYELVLGFAEPAATAPGQRVFTILCNGAPVAERLDPFARAGGPLRPFEIPVQVTAAGGSGVHLTFQPLTGRTLLTTLDLRRLPA